MPATMPVRMSPVPPVAIPGLPVVLTQASPSGRTTSVRCPLSTTINSCSRANFRATPNRSFCTSATLDPASRAISPGCGVITSVRPLPFSSFGAPLKRIQPVGIHHHRNLKLATRLRTNSEVSRIARNPRSNREHGLRLSPARRLAPAHLARSCPHPFRAKARSSTRDEIPPRFRARTSTSPPSKDQLPRAAPPSPPSLPTPALPSDPPTTSTCP